VLADASVARNFAVLGWVDHLVALAGGTLLIAHGVLGLTAEEPAELERIQKAFRDESARDPGSPAASAAAAALVGLDDLIGRRSQDIKVVVPTAEEFALAVRLHDPQDREWRRQLGVRARRLDAGEAVSIGIAIGRRLAFASDDDDARVAYLALGGTKHLWTLDLIQEAVARRLLSKAEAQAGYRRLCERYRFWGPPW